MATVDDSVHVVRGRIRIDDQLRLRFQMPADLIGPSVRTAVVDFVSIAVDFTDVSFS